MVIENPEVILRGELYSDLAVRGFHDPLTIRFSNRPTKCRRPLWKVLRIRHELVRASRRTFDGQAQCFGYQDRCHLALASGAPLCSSVNVLRERRGMPPP